MDHALSGQKNVSVTLSVDDWATVVAAVGTSPLQPETKIRVNSTIFECVGMGAKTPS